MPVLQPISDANPRAACIQLLLRWEAGGKFADEVLHEALASGGYNSFDRAFLTETFYGVLRHKSALDFLISHLRDAPLDQATRQITRLGLYQIFRMRIPHHAAVNETVNLAGRARGLVNALLRRSIREKEELEAALERVEASVRFSHPDFLVRRWEAAYTPEAAHHLCEWNNTPAEVTLRPNGLRVTAGELLSTASQVEPAGTHPLMLRARHLPVSWITQGLCYVQDPSTLLSVDLMGVRPGERVLDACAAPGGKTSYLAELMANEGRIDACDSSRHRLGRLGENLSRLGVTNTEVHQVDWLISEGPFAPQTFDRILVDAPCSNTGVIRRRVDVRWRLTPLDIEVMPERQRQMVERVVPLLKPGGTLVYSTCSLEPEENDLMAEALERAYPFLRLDAVERRLPHRDGTDGAFAARLVHAG